ncbi:MAG: hypothetical protein JJV99_09555 [Colwellia sp.]|nr:hypothetical protein [Colwellia sp.]
MSYEVNDDFYKKAYNTADSDQKYEGIKFQLGELGKQQTGLDRYINSQQAGYSRALDQLEAAQLQPSQQNMREAQSRGMVSTPGGNMQTQIATEAQRAQSYGDLTQEVSDQSVQLNQDQEDLDRDKAIAVQNSDFLANMV